MRARNSTLLVAIAIAIALPNPCHCDKPRFTDVTVASGLRVAAKTGVGGTNPHGVAVEDFNGDGLADVVLITFGKPHVYYFRNLGDLRFRDVTAGSGLESFRGEGTGAASADLDRDGRVGLTDAIELRNAITAPGAAPATVVARTVQPAARPLHAERAERGLRNETRLPPSAVDEALATTPRRRAAHRSHLLSRG